MGIGFMSVLGGVGDTAKEVSSLLNNQYKNDDVFKNVRKAVMETGNQGFQLMLAVTAAGCTCALIYAAIKLAGRDMRKREEGKSDVIRVLLCTAGIFSIVWIVYLVASVAVGVTE